MLTNNLGYPRIGSKRELKKSCEQYWSGTITSGELAQTARDLRKSNWLIQKDAGIDLIPSNDFSLYDQVLDMSLAVGAIPKRYHEVILNHSNSELDLYFAMARGYQKDGLDITAMEMTKWFDTNYHYIVPEFHKDQQFKLFSNKIADEYEEALRLGVKTKPVIIGPVSYLLLGKEKGEAFDRLDLLENLLPVYLKILETLVSRKVEWVQFDEPFLITDLCEKEKLAFVKVYKEIRRQFPDLKILLATYFGDLGEQLELAVSLPVHALHIDLVRNPEQLSKLLAILPKGMKLSLGVVDGRNIWKADYEKISQIVKEALTILGLERLIISPSCSLIHTPCDLSLETGQQPSMKAIRQWLSFARQKLDEVAMLGAFFNGTLTDGQQQAYDDNIKANRSRSLSPLIHNKAVKIRSAGVTEEMCHRRSHYSLRSKLQQGHLQLPLFPTTTIGSFPQTPEVRSWRAKYKKGHISLEAYESLLQQETEETIRFQEEAGLDVLVHGEFERNDMVEYFGEKLEGFAFSEFGWVQSYGSRCVKPPIIFGDVSRPTAMTVKWSSFAQSLSHKIVKGMLTGPVTILQWSFVRDDQPKALTCKQIALAIRDEVADLEQAGIKIIQIDEPAIREGLPIRKGEWTTYLDWAVQAFRIAASVVNDNTQIHTHMCYSEFNDIIGHIADMDADVITIECSRSQMDLLDIFAAFNYPNQIGPGVYDIHSPRIPHRQEMTALMEKAMDVIPYIQLWVNPDCGLKTRQWPETKSALIEMVSTARFLRESVKQEITIV